MNKCCKKLVLNGSIRKNDEQEITVAEFERDFVEKEFHFIGFQ